MKKKGFTMIELMISIAIIVVLSTTGAIAVSNRIKNNAVIEMKNRIPIFLKNSLERAYEKGKNYNLEININEKKIQVKSGEEDIDSLKLSKTLNYETTLISVKIKNLGYFNTDFKITVKYKEEEKFTVSVKTNESAGISVINIE